MHSLCKHILQKYQPPFSKRIASFRWKLSLLGLNIISFLVLPLPMKILVAYQEARSNSQWKEDAAMLFCISNNFQLWKNTLHIQCCSFLWQSSCMQSVRAVIWSSAVHALAFESFFFFQKMPSVISIQSRVGWLIRPLVLYNHSGKNVLFHKYKAEKCLKNLQSICERRRQDQKIIHLLLELCPQSSRSSQRSWWNTSWLFYILFCNLQNQSQSEDFSLLCYRNCEN